MDEQHEKPRLMSAREFVEMLNVKPTWPPINEVLEVFTILESGHGESLLYLEDYGDPPLIGPFG